MDAYDIAVIGAGPAGAMAAIRAAQLGKRVVLIERNDSAGRKILLTGKGRCNITNTAPLEAFIDKFGAEGRFLRKAFFAFSNLDLIDFFESKGLKLKAERQGRVFPVTDKAGSIVTVINRYLSENRIKVIYNTRVTGIKAGPAGFIVNSDKAEVSAAKVILATGGLSYKDTGSTGDGFRIAGRLGHKITPLKPALVPLKTAESWVKEVQGLTLKNVRLTFMVGNKKIVSEIGECLFTHFGVSGPLVLDLSGEIACGLERHKQAALFIDLKPGMNREALDKRLVGEFASSGSRRMKNIMKNLLPGRLVTVFMKLAGVDPDKSANQVTQAERRTLASLFKSLPLTVTGSLPVEEAMVTAGGVPAKEIDPRTMESRLVPGLYFAGEIIEGSAPSGGYNLQQAFSTGYLAGESAAHA